MEEVASPPKRCHVRIPVFGNLLVSNNKLFQHATTSNLSEGGMYVKGVLAGDGGTAPQVGLQLHLGLVLPRETEQVKILSEVMWVNTGEMDFRGASVVGLGIRFVEISEAHKVKIKQFIKAFRYQVLVVGENPDTIQEIEAALKDDFRVLTGRTGAEVMGQLNDEDISVLIADHKLTDMTAIELLLNLKDYYPNLPIIKIVLSGDPNIEAIESFINFGRIFHFLRKPVDKKEIHRVVSSAVETYALILENERLNTELTKSNDKLARENRHLRTKLGVQDAFENIVGNSTAIRDVLGRLEQVAHYPTTVHIRGETGTGKELTARALHNTSDRRDRPFMVFSCVGVPESLIESTLFGHTKGAFTGADQDRIGIFEEGDGGTVFLDEIGELTPAVQTRLLRVLQEGEVVPLGTTQPKKVDVRIVSATNRDLREEVEASRFRDDLFYRLVVFEIELPPLRKRAGDIPILAAHFLDSLCEKFDKSIQGFTHECLASLEAYPWPGNIRELENEIERAIIRTPHDSLVGLEELSPTIVAGNAPGTSISLSGKTLAETLRESERQLILDSLEQCDHVASRAADLLGVEPSTLGKKMKRLGIK